MTNPDVNLKRMHQLYNVITTLRSFIKLNFWLSMCYYHFSFFHHSAVCCLRIITSFRSFLALHLWLFMCYHHFSFLQCISGCLCIIITFLFIVKAYFGLSKRYYHFSCLNHGAPLVVYERAITHFCFFITVLHDEGLVSAKNIWTT